MTAAPAGKYRRYTDEEREIAIVFCQAGGRRLASKQTGIPDTTIQAWMDGKDSGYNSDEIASIGRSFVQSEILTALDEKINALLAAVNQERINDADLTAVTRALDTLLERRNKIATVTAITQEQLDARAHATAEIIARYVTDPATLDKIAADLERLDEPDSPQTAPGAEPGTAL